MKNHRYQTEQELPVSLEKAWAFFSSPLNLALITPPNLDFKLVAIPESAEIVEGMIIEYKLRPLLGLPVRWKTVISNVKKPYCFVDRQLKGPYQRWEHTHYFSESSNGVVVRDEVIYKLPFGIFGRFFHALVVRNRIKEIFHYRSLTLQKIFNQ